MKGSEFKAMRESLGLSQSELARLLGYSGKTAVSNLESKSRNPAMLACTLMRVLVSLPKRRSAELQELLLFHGAVEQRSRKGGT